MSRLAHGWASLLAAPLAACIASNVVAPEDRVVVADPQRLVFEPAAAADVAGYYASIDLQGDAAASLRRIYYAFRGDGRYSGAALADTDDGLAFTTLSGMWAMTGAGLVLDDAAAVPCERAPGHLRLIAPTGVVVLKREVLQ